MIDIIYWVGFILAMFVFLWGSNALIGVYVQKLLNREVGARDYLVSVFLYISGLIGMIAGLALLLEDF